MNSEKKFHFFSYGTRHFFSKMFNVVDWTTFFVVPFNFFVILFIYKCNDVVELNKNRKDMSTNARIWVKIDPQDYGKTLKADVEKLPLKLVEKNFPMVGVKIDPKPVAPLYIGVYVHFDGYFKGGVGETLCNHFKTYEQALNLVLLGDLSYVDATDGICSYHNWRGEDFHAVKVQYDEETFYKMLQQAYYDYEYVFENGKWTTVRLTFEDTLED